MKNSSHSHKTEAHSRAERRKRAKPRKSSRQFRWTYFDKSLVLFLSNRRIKSFTALMKLMTRIGDGMVWFMLCVFFMVLNVFWDGAAYIGVALAIALVTQVSLQTIIKNLFTRPRPYVQHEEISIVIPPPDQFSFPSGHTAGAFAVAFIFFFFIPQLFVPMVLLASLIAFSRMYLGLHYPTDIIAGVVLGLVSAIVGTQLTLLIEL